jgi:tetratricopeptide (TPR) repeat protein
MEPDVSANLLESLLAAPAAPDAVREQILDRAGGVPLFLISCAQSAQAGAQRVPWSVAQSVRRRVHTLSPTARALVETAAIAGRKVSREVLLAALDSSRGAPHGLDEACEAWLVAASDEGTYTFVHDLVQEAVEADVRPGRRAELHGRIARILVEHHSRAGAPASRIAHHYRVGGDGRSALTWTMRAGDEATAALSQEEAAEQYRAACKLAEELGDAPALAIARERRGRALSLLGRYQAALEELDRAGQVYRDLADVEGEARIAALAAIAWRELGRPEKGIAALEPMIARVSDSPPDDVDRSTTRHAGTRPVRGRAVLPERGIRPTRSEHCKTVRR